MECPSCGFAPSNGHAPHCLWAHTVEAPVNPRETSDEAWRSISGELPHLEAVVEGWVDGQRNGGATDDEIEVGTGLPHQTASARRNGLAKRGRVIRLLDEKGEPVKRETRSGRRAFVWVTPRWSRATAGVREEWWTR